MKAEFKNKGFGIIEILVAIGLSAFVLTAFLSLTWQTVKINQANIKELRARMHLKELIEIAKDLERSATSTIFAEGYYYPIKSTLLGENYWELVSVNDIEECEIDYDEDNLEGEFLDNENYIRWLKTEEVKKNIMKVTACIRWHNGFYKNKEGESDDKKYNRNLKLETYIYNYDF